MLGGGAVQNTPALDKNAPHTSCYPQDAEFNFFTQVMTLFSAQLFHALSHGVLPHLKTRQKVTAVRCAYLFLFAGIVEKQ